MRILCCLLLLGLYMNNASGESLELVHEWSTLKFNFPYDMPFEQRFRPDWTVPSGIAVGVDRIFMNIPRLREGVPATVAYLHKNTNVQNPILEPYPSWSWHIAGLGDYNCSRLISTYRSRIDQCNRLWILDAGVTTSVDDFTPVCPPKIMIFDLNTDRLVRQYVFPKESVRPNSLFTNLVIDDTTARTCNDVFVYITDSAGPGIVVYDASKDTSWRAVHASMFPHPDFNMYKIGNDVFELMDGVIGLGLSKRYATLYFHPFASNRLHSIPTAALRRGPVDFNVQLPVSLAGRKSSQSIALTVDIRDDSVLFAPVTETAIANWSPQSNRQRIVAQNPELLQFVAEIRNVRTDNDNLWFLSSRFQKFYLKTVNQNDINIRVMRVRDLQSLYPQESLPPIYEGAFNSYNPFNRYRPYNLYNNSVIP